MIYAYVLIEAEPTRVQDLIKELPDMELDGSVIKQVHAVTGRYDLIAFVESPDMQVSKKMFPLAAAYDRVKTQLDVMARTGAAPLMTFT